MNFRGVLEHAKRLWRACIRLLLPEQRGSPSGKSLELMMFEDRQKAVEALRSPNVFALIGESGAYKWAQMQCPCGCGEVLALNLMRSHRPRWEVHVFGKGLFSVNPSVDARKCGAHFWIRKNRIIWCG